MDKSELLTATCTCLASVIVLICVAVPSEGIDAAESNELSNNGTNLSSCIPDYIILCDSCLTAQCCEAVVITVYVALGVTNLLTVILCSSALYLSRRKKRNRLHHQKVCEEWVVTNPTYEEQCSDHDSATEYYASSQDQPTELSAQYSHLGPAHYESVRDVHDQRVMMRREGVGDGKRSNKRPARHTEPVNCPCTHYHEVHSDALHQWPQRLMPSDSHKYSRLYH